MKIILERTTSLARDFRTEAMSMGAGDKSAMTGYLMMLMEEGADIQFASAISALSFRVIDLEMQLEELRNAVKKS